jgi:hypothetical protein
VSGETGETRVTEPAAPSAQQPAREQQGQAARPQEGQAAPRVEITPELLKLMSETYSISEEELKLALERADTARRAVSVLDLIGKLSSLASKEARLAALPAVLRASSDDAEMASFVKWLLLLRELKDRSSELLVSLLLEERRQIQELLRRLAERSSDGSVSQQGQRRGALDELDRIFELAERLRRLASLFGYTERREPGLAEVLEVLAKYGGGQRDELMRKILLEVFNLGAESARAKAESDRAKFELLADIFKAALSKMSDGAMDAIAYSVANVLNALAERVRAALGGPAPQLPQAPPVPVAPLQQPAQPDLPPSVRSLLERIPPPRKKE